MQTILLKKLTKFTKFIKKVNQKKPVVNKNKINVYQNLSLIGLNQISKALKIYLQLKNVIKLKIF